MGDERNGAGGPTAHDHLRAVRRLIAAAEEQVRRCEAEVDRCATILEGATALLGHARRDLETLAGVEAFFARLAGGPPRHAPPPPRPRRAAWVPRVGLITDVLREAGRPLPVAAIVEAVAAAGMPLPDGPMTRRHTVYMALRNGQGKRFVRNDAGEWGLAPGAAGEANGDG